MNKIMNYFSQYHGTKELTHYSLLTRRANQSGNLDYSLNLANSGVVYDPEYRPRTIDLRVL